MNCPTCKRPVEINEYCLHSVDNYGNSLPKGWLPGNRFYDCDKCSKVKNHHGFHQFVVLRDNSIYYYKDSRWHKLRGPEKKNPKIIGGFRVIQ